MRQPGFELGTDGLRVCQRSSNYRMLQQLTTTKITVSTDFGLMLFDVASSSLSPLFGPQLVQITYGICLGEESKRL